MNDNLRDDEERKFYALGNFGDGHKFGQIQAYEIFPDGSVVDKVDYEKFYDLESYLFTEVSTTFHRQGWVSTLYFFCIIIWKANRAKSKIAKRLKAQCDDDLDLAVYRLTSELFEASTPERKLRVLMGEWGFLLPMASAILTVFYPDDFTIYDTRVCDSLGDFHDLYNKTKLSRVWEGYERFVVAVKAASPQHLSLRDKDRYLWGKSFFSQLKDDVYAGFPSRAETEMPEASANIYLSKRADI